MPYHNPPFTNPVSVSTTFSSATDSDALSWDDGNSLYYQSFLGLAPQPPEDYSRMNNGVGPSAAPHQHQHQNQPSTGGTGSDMHHPYCPCSTQTSAYANAPAPGSRVEGHPHGHGNGHGHGHSMRAPAPAVEAPSRPGPSASRAPNRRERQTYAESIASTEYEYSQQYTQQRSTEFNQRCRWEGCQYAGRFSREASLLRHVRLIHVAPRQYVCPIGVNCRRTFNRKDNLDSHIQSVHRLSYQASDLELVRDS